MNATPLTGAGVSLEPATLKAQAAVFEVTCTPSGRTLEVRSDETIVAAGLRQGIMLAHSCRNGRCGTCKGKVLAGHIEAGSYEAAALSDRERSMGYALLCQARPLSPLTIECNVVSAGVGVPVRKLPARVQSLERLAPDVMRIRLKLPVNQRFQFLAGQYLDILMPGIRRSLSMANAPHESEVLELHLRNYGGPFSQHVFNTLKVGDLLRLEGPLGTFFVREESDKPIIFLASGTGFAPIKAMIQHELQKRSGRSMTLYWGGRRPADLYLDAVVRQWVADRHISYVPVVSEHTAEDNWSGRTGFVHRAVMDDFPDLAGHQVYACGAPIVVESARNDFTNGCKLPLDQFFADVFLPGSTTPVAVPPRT